MVLISSEASWTSFPSVSLHKGWNCTTHIPPAPGLHPSLRLWAHNTRGDISNPRWWAVFYPKPGIAVPHFTKCSLVWLGFPLAGPRKTTVLTTQSRATPGNKRKGRSSWQCFAADGFYFHKVYKNIWPNEHSARASHWDQDMWRTNPGA